MMTNDIQRDLGRVEGKLDSLIAKVDDDIKERRATVASHDKRIRTVENRQYYFMGGGAVIGALLSYVAKAIAS